MTETKGLAQSSVCLRSKRSEVRILSGVPETNNLGAEQTTPDALPGAAKDSGTTAKCEHRLDHERLRLLWLESRSWPAYMRAPLGVKAPSRWLPEGGAK